MALPSLEMEQDKIVWSGSGLAGINCWDYGIEKKIFVVGIVGLKNPIGDPQMCFVYKVGNELWFAEWS